MTKILILGGIREASDLAKQLTEEGHDVTTSLAGRTKEPEPIAGNVRIGGFGGVSGLVEYIKQGNIERLIDYTHPFAKQISKNAIKAAKITKIEFETIERPLWQKQAGDHWIEVNSLEQARDIIPRNAVVLLALGHQHIDLFQSRKDVKFIVRMVDQPEQAPPLEQHQLIIGRPSHDWKIEYDMLVRHQITHIICRNSGGSGAYAKIRAAREIPLEVIIINR